MVGRSHLDHMVAEELVMKLERVDQRDLEADQPVVAHPEVHRECQLAPSRPVCHQASPPVLAAVQDAIA